MARGIFPWDAAGTSRSTRLGRMAGVALALGALPGCGSSTTTVTQTRSVTIAAGSTKTVTVTATTENSPASSASSFSGTGTKFVGAIAVSLNSTLDWTCSGNCSRFRITNNPNDPDSIAVDASGSSGSIPIVAGTYHDVEVTTGGKWVFTMVAAGGP